MNTSDDAEILLVDNNPRDGELTMQELQRRRLANRLVWLRDGAQALDFLLGTGPATERPRNRRLKVVLLDLKLPGVDGLEVLRRLKSDAETKSIPVVVFTASRAEPDVVRSYEWNANSYVVKPADPERFSEAVGHIGVYWLLRNQAPESRYHAGPPA